MKEPETLQPATQEFAFLYANGGLYIALLLAFFAVWLVGAAAGEQLLYRLGAAPPGLLAPAVFLAGLAGGYISLRGPLRFLYLFRGTGTVRADGFDVRLRFSRYSVPYSHVRRVFYKETKTGRGFLLGAKGASFFIEEARSSGSGEDASALYEFYRAVESGWKQ